MVVAIIVNILPHSQGITKEKGSTKYSRTNLVHLIRRNKQRPFPASLCGHHKTTILFSPYLIHQDVFRSIMYLEVQQGEKFK